MQKKHRKNIIAIEAWNQDSVEPKPTMKALLDFVTIINGSKYSYNYLYTFEELAYILKNISTKNFSLLYLATHGRPENISTGLYSEFDISLPKLAEMMGTRFEGMGLHFAACAVMSSTNGTLEEFKYNTGLKFISGYTQYVDFLTSSVVDHIFLNNWLYSRNFKRMFERMKKSHKIILQENGFKYLA